MGLFDKFFKNNNAQTKKIQPRQPYAEPEQPFNLTTDQLSDGSIQYEFHDNTYDMSRYYDTTRLIVQSQSTLGNRIVFNCLISWYGESDCQIFGRDGKPHGRFDDYKSISVELDLNALQNDPEYLQTLMRDLLSQNRVVSHLNESLNDTRKCGNYMGGVYRKESGEYTKYSAGPAAIASHNSPTMVNQRMEYQQSKEAARQAQIERKRAEIAKLNADIDDLSK